MRQRNDGEFAQEQWTLFEFQPQKLKKPTSRSVRVIAPVGEGWQLENHVCQHCFGRIASKTIPGGMVQYRCTNCAAEAKAIEPSMLCACGIKLHAQAEGKRVGPATRDAGIRCVANPKRSPSHPSEFVAMYIDPKDRK